MRTTIFKNLGLNLVQGKISLLIQFVILVLSSQKPCPERCICRRRLDHVLCINKGMTSIPDSSQIPLNTTALFLQNNNLQQINYNFTRFKYLTSLILSHNGLTSITPNDFVGLESLETLLLESNRIQFIEDGAFKHLRNLLYLKLSGNKITSLNSGVLLGLHNLTILELDNNSIDFLDDDTFSSVPKLTNLDLDMNNITTLQESVFAKMSQLRQLNFDRNQLKSFDRNTFSNLMQLDRLYLRHNRLAAIRKYDFSRLTNLQQLHLDYNMISSIDAHSLTNLTRLKQVYMYGNRIMCDDYLTTLRLISSTGTIYTTCFVSNATAVASWAERIAYTPTTNYTADERSWSTRQLLSHCDGTCKETPYNYVKGMFCRNCSRSPSRYCRHASSGEESINCFILEFDKRARVSKSGNNNCLMTKCAGSNGTENGANSYSSKKIEKPTVTSSTRMDLLLGILLPLAILSAIAVVGFSRRIVLSRRKRKTRDASTPIEEIPTSADKKIDDF